MLENNVEQKQSSHFASMVVGVLVIIVGVAMAIVFLVEFNSILSHDLSSDLRAAIRALQLTTVSLWLGGAFLGAFIIRDRLEREQTEDRLNQQAKTLEGIERVLRKGDEEREEVNRRSLSFWSWRRSERIEKDGYE